MVQVMANKTWHVSLYLFLEGTQFQRSILRIPKGTRLIELPQASTLKYPHLAYVVRNKSNTPSWAQHLSDHFKLGNLKNQASSFVLLFEACERIWAISHGNGYHLIPPNSIEPRFGIRVVANCIDPLAIQTVDTRTTDVISRTTRAQISRGSAIGDLGVTVDRELIQYLAGAPTVGDDAESWASRLAGSDSLQVSVTWGIDDLAERAAEFLERFTATEYKESFGFIDNYRPLRTGDAQISVLNRELETLIADRDSQRVSLAVPGVLDEESFGRFVISHVRKSQTIDELNLPEVYQILDEWSVESSEILSKVKIRIVDKDGEIIRPAESLSRYITAEVHHNASTYVLLTNQWFSIDDGYVQKVNSEIQHLVKNSRRHSLPDWQPKMTEAQYNQSAAELRQWQVIGII